jgi:hypothetical protein
LEKSAITSSIVATPANRCFKNKARGRPPNRSEKWNVPFSSIFTFKDLDARARAAGMSFRFLQREVRLLQNADATAATVKVVKKE